MRAEEKGNNKRGKDKKAGKRKWKCSQKRKFLTLKWGVVYPDGFCECNVVFFVFV